MTTKKEVTMKDIWKKLSSINVSKHAKVKNNLSYLAWSDAIALVMQHYPDMSYDFQLWTDGNGNKQLVNMVPNDKGWTGIVACTVVIEGHEKHMILPIMTGFSNKAVLNPTSRDITDSLMRCLTKCLAMFGLGHHLYTGEELPKDYAEEKHTNGVNPKVQPLRATPKIQPVTTTQE